MIEEDIEESAIDACLIAAGQRAEHYEMAAYGTLVAWAKAMEHTEAADLLEETLEEEKAADKKLTSLAEGGINEEAARSTHSQDEDENEDAEEASVGKSSPRGPSSSLTSKKLTRKR